MQGRFKVSSQERNYPCRLPQCIKTGEILSKEVIGFRSDNHVIHATKTKKKALTSWYDKMQMIDEINNVPFGYKGAIDV
jgi:hypothetical protein